MATGAGHNPLIAGRHVQSPLITGTCTWVMDLPLETTASCLSTRCLQRTLQAREGVPVHFCFFVGTLLNTNTGRLLPVFYLFGDDSMTMQAFMWQHDLHGVARFIHAYFASLTDSAGGCWSSNQPLTAGLMCNLLLLCRTYLIRDIMEEMELNGVAPDAQFLVSAIRCALP